MPDGIAQSTLFRLYHHKHSTAHSLIALPSIDPAPVCSIDQQVWRRNEVIEDQHQRYRSSLESLNLYQPSARSFPNSNIMSEPPTHYDASARSSQELARPVSPPTPAELRSQAIAKLKRAASLPRTPGGKRANSAQTTPDATPLVLTPTYPSLAHPPTHAQDSPSRQHGEGEEVLSPSPVMEAFDRSRMYATPSNGHPGMAMQRSASASSSYHMPSPHLSPYASNLGAPYYANSPTSAHASDWAAMQMAQSYLPSMSPAGNSMPPSSYNAPGGQAIGRNTPSPLPTLGELRTLSRSNSNAARAHAMNKLTGGRNTPASDDEQVGKGKLVHPGLQRADSLGASRMLGAYQPALAVEVDEVKAADPAASRPRLQRSFTVSSTNMGEERRSAVGRRMVAQLGKRRVAREQEEDEVRRLWEERRAATDESDVPDEPNDEHQILDDYHVDDQIERENGADDGGREDEQYSNNNNAATGGQPLTTPEYSETAQYLQTSDDMLNIPDRSISRGTMRSADEAFEYEAHLRRSLSSRTARGAVGTLNESMARVEAQSSVRDSVSDVHGDDREEMHEPSILQALEPLALPQPHFASSSASRHTPNASTSTQGTVQGNHSPGESVASRDALGSMMFVMGGTSADAKAADNWPSEVEDHISSEWGTPAKDQHRKLSVYTVERC